MRALRLANRSWLFVVSAQSSIFLNSCSCNSQERRSPAGRQLQCLAKKDTMRSGRQTVDTCRKCSGTGMKIVKCGSENDGLTMKKRSTLPILGLALVGLLLVSGRSYGFKQEDLDKLSATGQCLFCDLSQADLSAADLSGNKLTGARLPGANLSDAKLSNTNLRNAYLSRARLTNANLSGADLSGADLPDAQLRGANLSGANLSHANLPKAILSSADLSHAKLLGADLSSADLTGASLSTADFSGATWPDGKKCGAGSLGECKKDTSRSDQRPTGGRGSRGGSGVGMGR